MHSFKPLLSIFGLLVALLHTSVLAAPTQLAERARYNAADALDSTTVYNWLLSKGSSYADPTKIVFYSAQRSSMATAFTAANPGYKWYDEVYGPAFEADFGIASASVSQESANAMSKALATYASDTTYVFGASDAAAASVWKTIELPAIKAGGKIKSLVSLSDGATAVTDTIGTLAIDGATATVLEGAVADLLEVFELIII